MFVCVFVFSCVCSRGFECVYVCFYGFMLVPVFKFACFMCVRLLALLRILKLLAQLLNQWAN